MYLERTTRVVGVRQHRRSEKELVYMKLMNGSGRTRRRVALGAAAIAAAVAGSLVAVASPAQAAEPDHCVMSLSPANMRCFNTDEEADAFVKSVAEVIPEKGPGFAAQRANAEATRSSSVAVVQTLIMKAYDWENYNWLGGTLRVIGLGPVCSLTTADVDYETATLPARWVNDISSYRSYGVCWAKLYRDPNFLGPSVGYAGSSATIGGGLNNAASSIRFS